MKKSAILLALVAGLFAVSGQVRPAQAAPKLVLATTIVDHPVLAQIMRGVRDGLAAAGYPEGEGLTWREESAQGNVGTAAQIARKYVGEHPDAIVVLGTPSVIAMAQATKEIPVIFGAMTDPVGARVVQSLEHPGGNVTGTTDMLPVDRHLDTIATLFPAVRRIGVVFNPGEANAVSQLAALKAAVATRPGWQVVEAAAPNSGGVQQAARSLAGKSDLFYIMTDNTVEQALDALLKVARDAKLPSFASDTSMVEQGAIVGLGFDYYQIGRLTGTMVAQVLGGAKPAEVPVGKISDLTLIVNPKAAAAIGYTIPEAFAAKAKLVGQ
ncbi:MAG: ABC transporter substrate-binding protein [Azospirillaceae bacterium]|nr:ABC transporter substrate-binding protein [Azospirillaceae bacterium]